MKKLLMFLKKEILELIPPFIFFFIAISTTQLVLRLVAKELGTAFDAETPAIIGALIIGKCILIADALPFVGKAGNKRLISVILLRFIVNLFVVFSFQIIEKLFHLRSDFGSFGKVIENFADEIHWDRFLSTLIILSIFLVMYSTATSFIEIVGAKRLGRMLLSPVEVSSEDS